jgi:hypothetical protein
MARGEDQRRQTAAIPSRQRDGTASSLPATGEGTEPAGPAGASGTEDEFAPLTPSPNTESVNKASNTHTNKFAPLTQSVNKVSNTYAETKEDC